MKNTAYSLTRMLPGSLVLLMLLTLPVHAQSPSITLTPERGVSATTIRGSGFKANSTITIYWDGVRIPTVPNQVTTDETGAFTCIISVYNQTAVGSHQVKARDAAGNEATATFTVIDVRGPTGERGPVGASAEGIPPGFLAGLFLLAAGVGGLMGGVLGRRRRAEEKGRPRTPRRTSE